LKPNSTPFSSNYRTIPSLLKSQNAFRTTFRRTYMEQSVPKPQAGDFRQRVLYGAGIFGATLLGINLVFNRDTREDGGMPAYERSYLNETFLHTGLGLGIIGIAARTLHMVCD
jgi:growth hormone-inducible transmembrane protein